MGVSLSEIQHARRAISPWVRRTPVVYSQSLSRKSGADVYLKLETIHDTGAFKIRGATNKILSLSDKEKARGVVAVSTGNHGRAVALAARRLGVKATVCLSELVPANKRKAIEDLGARLHVSGRSQDEAEIAAKTLMDSQGLVPVHPFDDPKIIAGQGTIGLELLEDLNTVDCLLVGLSGGGLAAGIGLALKSASSATRMVGISMERGPAMIRSIEANEPVLVDEESSLADSLGGGIGIDNKYTFKLVKQHVDEFYLLNERQIADGMVHLYREERVIAEGGGAVPVSAIVHEMVSGLKGTVVCVISGNNVDMDVFTRIINGTYPFED